MLFLKRFHLSEFIKPRENADTYPEVPKAFKVCGFCGSDDPGSVELLARIAEFGKQEGNCFRNGMRLLLKVANSGRLLQSHYDEKQCHQTHEFVYNGETYTIWRIRNNDIRLLFFYASDRIVLLLDSFPKRANSLTKAQKLNAENAVKRYIDNANAIKFVGEKDEQH